MKVNKEADNSRSEMEDKLNFHREESNERRKRGGAFPIGTIYFFRLASQKTKAPPQMQRFAKYWMRYYT